MNLCVIDLTPDEVLLVNGRLVAFNDSVFYFFTEI